jgi:hypothetical protein
VTARRRDERGSLAVEMAMIAPGLLFIIALVYAYGRVGQVNGVMESGTRDAARSATLARSQGDAERRAQAAVADALKAAPPSCRDHVTVTVVGADPDHPGAFVRGAPIRVEASCRYDISDLGLPGAPGSLTSRSTFTSMLDPYRGVK